MTEEKPEGIIVTISASMLGNGYRHWLSNFLNAMERNARGEEIYYWLRLGKCPKKQNEISSVYLCIGGKIRFKAFFGGSKGPGEKTFLDGTKMYGNAWLILAGPVERPKRTIKMKGFQGFRYTTKLF